MIKGENSQIPRFGKICDKLALFWKYLAIYHFFSTRVSQNRVLNSIRVPSESPAWHCWPGICVIKKIMWYSILLKSSFFIVLKLHTVEYLFIYFFIFYFFSFFYFLFHTKLLLRKYRLVFRTTTMLTLSIYI